MTLLLTRHRQLLKSCAYVQETMRLRDIAETVLKRLIMANTIHFAL